MTQKRFNYEGAKVFDNDELLCCTLSIWAEQLVDLLNELNDKCEFLEIENEALEDGATKYAELCHKSLKENEQLKKENEELKQELLETIDDLSDNRPNKKGFAGSGRFA